MLQSATCVKDSSSEKMADVVDLLTCQRVVIDLLSTECSSPTEIHRRASGKDVLDISLVGRRV